MRQLLLNLLFFILLHPAMSQEQVRDEVFWQEYHEPFPWAHPGPASEIKSIAVDRASTVWITNAEGVFAKAASDSTWQAVLPEADRGPAFSVIVDGQSNTWMATWKGVFVAIKGQLSLVNGTDGPIASLCLAPEGIYAAGPNGVWLYNGATFVRKDYKVARSVRGIASDGQGGIWLASDVGLYHCSGTVTKCFQKQDVLASAYVKGLALDTGNRLWAAGLGGVSVIRGEKKMRELGPRQGLPTVYVNCVARAPDGVMWVGTDVGVVRYQQDGSHSLRFTRRWLLDDHVNAIAFDIDGNAWIATAKGVSAIKKRKMDLAGKEQYFYDVLMKRHIRAPWTSGQCYLKIPGDIRSWQPDDDDNDGEFTGNYLAMESFRYAVTHDEDAKQKARKGFYFLKKLQEVTGRDGFFARCIIPVDWKYRVHDMNRNYTEREIAEELVKEPRYKPVEVRWHPSADGKWLWKGDASSDEWCGHMMGYYFYYELVADETEKQVVRKHVASLVDHLIANNFNMVDVDGDHTRWAVWSPRQLNQDPEWAPDKCQNSMEMLTFLKLAYYMTGDIKYQNNYLHLINQEKYLENMSGLLNQDPAWFIYFDVTLESYLYPILLHCETDTSLLTFYRKHLDAWMDQRRNDKNPLINFLYCYARGQKTELAASVDFLRDTPLDLIEWRVDHTKREDVQLVHVPVLNDLQVSELPPPSIRVAVRWDKNPWLAADGYPDMEREPVFWLLPYWMGRFLRMIN